MYCLCSAVLADIKRHYTQNRISSMEKSQKQKSCSEYTCKSQGFHDFGHRLTHKDQKYIYSKQETKRSLLLQLLFLFKVLQLI
jgi:hypothetical protein